MNKIEKLKTMRSYFPNATIELDYNTPWQLLIAVTLSAQTTDKAVNKVTKNLFLKYPTSYLLSIASFDDVYCHVKHLGLANQKTRNIISLSKIYFNDFNDEMPKSREKLVSLPGVGIKTANVCLANIYNLNYIAVDTHIHRICIRLAIVPNNSNVLDVEKTLTRLLKNENLNDYHHSLIFFGRYHCKARNPMCLECKLKNNCRFYKKEIK